MRASRGEFNTLPLISPVAPNTAQRPLEAVPVAEHSAGTRVVYPTNKRMGESPQGGVPTLVGLSGSITQVSL